MTIGSRSSLVEPGTYRVVLNLDGQELVQPLRIVGDPNLPAAAQTLEADEEILPDRKPEKLKAPQREGED